ncbi:STY4528 family pathogenicity island replication protein [Aggregatibacter actinomycetemcomitans]|uniref:STY4528 family pathogenicity island replication protein n=1 Tax=Aggregatibacter actinomycetemcomitans TaxID=714 RepID=UPI001E2B199C|nr:STY4528 family pathogenicity island replication protein [Aggregatibacter actinomycetemcomitans]
MMDTIPLNQVRENGLLFFGNQHETVPTRLLFDPYLTARAKLAWQLIKYKAREFQTGLFPSYDTLGKLLSDKTYADGQLSRKLVSQTLLLLRLTRWLTLCETVRNEHGQVMGNVYLLHDEPMPIIDTIQLNSDYLKLLESAVKHNDVTVRNVANHIIENLLSDNAQWHYISHIDWMKARFIEYQKRIKQEQTINEEQQHQLGKIQQDILSSHTELSQNDRELSKNLLSSQMELSQKSQSSDTELRPQNDANSLISGSVPKWNSGSQYSTGTSIYINKYCTGKVAEIDWPTTMTFSPLEKQAVAQTMKGLDLGLCKALLFEVEQRITKGEVKKPQGYLMSMIQRAHRGEFKPYFYEQHLAEQHAKCSKTQIRFSQPPSSGISDNKHTKQTAMMATEHERQARAESIRKFKAALCG